MSYKGYNEESRFAPIQAVEFEPTEPREVIPFPDRTGARKDDGGKAPVFQGFIAYFPRAIEAVAQVSAVGSKKYANGKFPTAWRLVPDAANRFTDAQVRHLIEEAKGTQVDPETKCLHLAHEAWNALARLELFLTKAEYPLLSLTREESQ